jgi:putative photosynthetic complex assembly protein 2
MATLGLPICLTLILWWFGTGIILYLDSLKPQTFRWSMIGATLAFTLALYGISRTSGNVTPLGACAAFCFGLTAWGWQLASFYFGYVTGPRKTGCDAGVVGFRRFIEAARTSLYHELVAVASALVIVALSWGEPNKTALWTFLLLWSMHLSAKLNLYFGVPSLNETLLPHHLKYLVTFMRCKPMNHFFPVAITAATVGTTLLVKAACEAPPSSYAMTNDVILATLMMLGLLEHWLLVTPHQINAIWQWRRNGESDALPFRLRATAPCLVASDPLAVRAATQTTDEKEYLCAASY